MLFHGLFTRKVGSKIFQPLAGNDVVAQDASALRNIVQCPLVSREVNPGGAYCVRFHVKLGDQIAPSVIFAYFLVASDDTDVDVAGSVKDNGRGLAAVEPTDECSRV